MRKETLRDIIGGSKRLLTLTLVKSKSFEDPSVFLKAPLSSWKKIRRTEHNFPSLRSKLASELFRNLLPRSFPSWRSRSAWRRRRSLWRGTRRTCIGRRRLRVLPGRRGWCRWPSSAWPSRQRRWEIDLEERDVTLAVRLPLKRWQLVLSEDWNLDEVRIV